jgi:hypothetical protein
LTAATRQTTRPRKTPSSPCRSGTTATPRSLRVLMPTVAARAGQPVGMEPLDQLYVAGVLIHQVNNRVVPGRSPPARRSIRRPLNRLGGETSARRTSPGSTRWGRPMRRLSARSRSSRAKSTNQSWWRGLFPSSTITSPRRARDGASILVSSSRPRGDESEEGCTRADISAPLENRVDWPRCQTDHES